MKIQEAFFQILKSPGWIIVYIAIICFLIYAHITLPLKINFKGIFFLFSILLLTIIIFSIFISLVNFIEFLAIRDFQKQLQMFKLKSKFLFFCFSFEGEYRDKKFEINLLPTPALPIPNLFVIYRLYTSFPFKVIVKKDNLEQIEFYYKRREIQEVIKKLINTFRKVEISYQWVQVSEVVPFGLLTVLFKTRLTPERVIGIIKELSRLTECG